ncbi:antitoxin [Arsenicicoccus dermatophilus]|uniref:antitoxin n=1 Tax=Arsenicicoccus dermatophilus TaxID=1076331 RepID=UPI0039171595
MTTTPPGRPQQSTPAPGTPPTAPTASPVDTFTRGALDAAKQAREQVARTAAANRGRIAAALDKLGGTVDSRTGGKYHEQVETAKTWVHKGVDVVAGGPGATTTTSASPGTAPAPGTLQHAATTSPAAPPAQPMPAPSSSPAPPAPPQEGWHRGPDGQWVRS